MNPSWTERSVAPEKLVERAIAALEHHIRDTYGLKVQLGAELEFAADIPPSHPLHITMSKVESRSHPDYRPLREQPTEKQALNPYYVNSAYISNIHREACNIQSEPRCQQYELVFSHTAVSPTQLARAIETEKQRLLNDKGLKNVSFSAELLGEADEDHMHNGLHLNISLIPESNLSLDLPIFIGSNQHNSPCINGMRSLHKEGQWLLGHDSASIHRLDFMQMNQDCYKVRSSPNGTYIENRTAPASALAGYAILLSLAGIAHGLYHTKHPLPQAGNSAPYPDAIAMDFKSGTMLEAVLNRIEPSLGSQLKAAMLSSHAPWLPRTEITTLLR